MFMVHVIYKEQGWSRDGELGWQNGESSCLPMKGVLFPNLTSHEGWVCCWISSLLWGFFSAASSSKPNTQNSNSIQWTKKHFVDVIQFTPCTLFLLLLFSTV